MAEYESHPSWGMVQFSRVQHGGPCRLFGSSLEDHGTTILLHIFQGRREHDLSEDHLMGGNELVAVELSAAQFAGLLTTMNIGHGVPCTIRRLPGQEMPDVPDDSRESERVRQSFGEHIDGIRTKLSDLLAKADAVLSGPIKASDRKDLRERLARIKAAKMALLKELQKRRRAGREGDRG